MTYFKLAWIVLTLASISSCRERDASQLSEGQKKDPLTYDQRLANAKSCLDRSWATTQPSIDSADSYNRDASHVVKSIFSRQNRGILGIPSYVASFYSLDASVVTEDMNNIAEGIKKLAESLPEKDRELKAACMVSCVSSSLIEYKRRHVGLESCVSSTVRNGTGDCKDFADLGVWFGRQVGLTIDWVENKEHAYNAIYSHELGKWLYLEPQSKACVFMDPEWRGKSIALESPNGEYGVRVFAYSNYNNIVAEFYDCREEFPCKKTSVSNALLAQDKASKKLVGSSKWGDAISFDVQKCTLEYRQASLFSTNTTTYTSEDPKLCEQFKFMFQ